MKNHERVERELLEQCGQVATLFRVAATMRRAHRATRRTLSDAKRPRLAVGHRQYTVTKIARLAGAKTQLKCLYTLASTRMASTRQKISCLARDAFENRVPTGVVINANYIEPRRFKRWQCSKASSKQQVLCCRKTS